MSFSIARATRKAVPILVSLSGVSGSGKSYSALLLAAGLAGKGRVGYLDTENGRGSMYADSPGILAALPNGYDVADMAAPFPPTRYAEAVAAFESAGCKVLVIDSMTHEWEGDGGCCDVAENNKMRGTPNWAMAKMMHKRLMNRLLASPMHLVFCLRAREKVRMFKDAQGKNQVEPIGIQPIQEKNFVFEMTVSILLDERTHLPTLLKCPEPLLGLFAPGELLSKRQGEEMRAWSEAAPAPTLNVASLEASAKEYASQGVAAYAEFFGGLPLPAKKALNEGRHAEFKAAAQAADAEAAKRAADADGGYEDEPPPALDRAVGRWSDDEAERAAMQNEPTTN